jgi:hypothetical protein
MNAPGKPDVAELRGWDVVTADGVRLGQVAAATGSPGTMGSFEVELVAGAGPPPPAAEELRAGERGLEVLHARATAENPPGSELLGDVNPAPGAHYGSPEEPVRPPDSERAARDRLGGGRLALPLDGVQLDRAARRVVLAEASHELGDTRRPRR